MLIKILSMKQPWAELLIRGIKAIETRSWEPGNRLKKGEKLYIHASKTYDDIALEIIKSCCPDEYYNKVILPSIKDLTFGALIGIVWFDYSIKGEQIPVNEVPRIELLALCPVYPDHFYWNIMSSARIEPIKMKGELGIFKKEIDPLEIKLI